LLRGGDEDGVQGQKLLEALAALLVEPFTPASSTCVKELFLNRDYLYRLISSYRNLLRDPD
jgi:hypothetical protein